MISLGMANKLLKKVLLKIKSMVENVWLVCVDLKNFSYSWYLLYYLHYKGLE